MKNHTIYQMYVQPVLRGISASAHSICDVVLSVYHACRGSWYCQFCGTLHPRRRVKYALQIERSKITIVKIPVHATVDGHQLVCYKGRHALKINKWRPKTSDLADTPNTMLITLKNLFSTDINTDSVPRHVDQETRSQSQWEPKIFFECNPLLNSECKKTNCWIYNVASPQGCCNRTTNPRYSSTGLVLWPDDSLSVPTGHPSSPTCRHCPLDPAKCRQFQATQGHMPCKVTATYSDFMLRK